MTESHLTPIEQKLVAMQEKLVDELTRRLEGGVMTAAEMTVALNLLKANGIDVGTGKVKGQLEHLGARLPFRDPEAAPASEVAEG